ncbi:MAG: hypothetical protein CM15mV91_110 [uncultured marine virus]|nr:MAG: hypothetical protein CM15mV91_110 [uncultured marine virus]
MLNVLPLAPSVTVVLVIRLNAIDFKCAHTTVRLPSTVIVPVNVTGPAKNALSVDATVICSSYGL